MYTHIALSGGGYRALCHLGVLAYLEDQNLLDDVHSISGSSAGALVAAMTLLNDCKNIPALHKACLEKNAFTLVPTNPQKRYGVFRLTMTMLEDALEYRLGSKRASFKDLKRETSKRLIVPAFRVTDGETVFFGEDTRTEDVPILDAVLASSSIPPLVSPVRIGGDLHVDGGIASNVPLYAFRNIAARHVLGVCLHSNPMEVTSVSEYMAAIISAMIQQLNKGHAVHQERTLCISGLEKLGMDWLSLQYPGKEKATAAFCKGYRDMHEMHIKDTRLYP